MKIVKKIIVSLVLLFSFVALVGCSNVSQKYADKINDAAAANEHYTVSQIRKDLGDECFEYLFLNTGVIISVKDITSKEEFEAKINANEDVEGIIIFVVNSKAQSAEYRLIKAEDLK